MPIYEYQCESCGHQLEVTQRMSEAPLTECPACKQPRLARLISATSFQLKGGGWYRDGYGKPKKDRSDNQVTDRLSKALKDDAQKESAKSESSSTSSESTASAAPAAEKSSSGGSGTAKSE